MARTIIDDINSMPEPQRSRVIERLQRMEDDARDLGAFVTLWWVVWLYRFIGDS